MTDDFDPYTPIACDLHSQYELAIIRRSKLRLAWRNGHGRRHIGLVLPLDLYCRNGNEYMAVQNHDGLKHEIRLDRIYKSRPADSSET